ncbi:TPA: ISAs1 family transposase, partial [Legionella pneumophila]|nr:ISAs1 family transposase [Legionella pneumophila]HCR5120709.1 ISAs1 family transposase [Legionella pneumophila]HCR5307960.1 ISAs1 family transposase [Legionella pneumophila]HCR5311101.1 ISAs1 family transposase [Legionella pneumophila]HCR5314287.1 ISAs1 family transposase [Legionella pneumophila]
KDFGEEKLDWLRQYRDFKHGIPADDTIARVISALDSEQFTLCFVNWVNELRSKDGREQIAIDGKTLRRSYTGDRTTALHSITAWSKRNGLILAQMRSNGKANEKASVLEMLDLLELKGAIVTADAMNTEKKIAKKIHDKGGDYVLCVKNNHKKLLNEIKDYFHIMERDHREIWSQNYFEEVDAGHGRIETRTCRQIAISPWVEGYADWQGLQTVIEVTRTREIKEKTGTEVQYYISSLPLEPKQIA